MEPNSGRLPGLEATGPQMEPRATSSAAAPLRRQFRVLVGVTGSVAALKLPLLVSKLLDIPDLEVAVVTTERAKHFYSPRDVPVTLYSDADEWEMWKRRSDPVLHIDLRRWADLMLVAPLDANTLGKVASGICDNLLTCVIRAWDRSKPLLFCPAMNTAMWEHPITEQQVGQLKDFGYIEIPCVAKKLVCGDQALPAAKEPHLVMRTCLLEVLGHEHAPLTSFRVRRLTCAEPCVLGTHDLYFIHHPVRRALPPSPS
uniref:Phosphopantothenoylcysteine decarboxylase n=2 Tax=Bos TaxID=9903 RepID=A0A3Q1MNK4_BOVIN